MKRIAFLDYVRVFACFLVSVCDGGGYHYFRFTPDGSLTFSGTLQGKKDTIKVEELSTMQNFDEFMNVTEPTMTVGTRTTGTL